MTQPPSSPWERADPEGRYLRADYAFGSAGMATCSAVQLGDGKLALVSPPGGPRASALYEALDQVGEVSAIIAPNAFHRLGMPVAAARYPGAGLYAPTSALGRVGRVAPRPVRPLLDLKLPDGVEIFVPPHMRGQDVVVRLHTPVGTLWTLHDPVLNIQTVSSNPVERWLLGLLGYQPGLRVNRFGCRFVLLADRAAYGSWLRSELERLPPAIFVPGHGPMIRDSELLARMPALAMEIAGERPRLTGPGDY